VVSVLAIGPQGSRVQTQPRTMDFKGDKIRSTPSFGGEVKELYEHEKMLVGKIQRPCFSPVFHTS
jgi:hypothetical protein